MTYTHRLYIKTSTASFRPPSTLAEHLVTYYTGKTKILLVLKMFGPTNFLAIFLVTLIAAAAVAAEPPPQTPRAFFVFGDSLVDNGNNNYLITPARADLPPYGIDSPSHSPSGRFSNGLNIPDRST